jgi:hypothetical protein
VSVEWLFVPLPPRVRIDQDKVSQLAQGFFNMQLCWDAPGGSAPKALRQGVSILAWLRPGSLVGVVLERTLRGMAIGLQSGGSPSDWGLGICLAVALARETGSPIHNPEGDVVSPEQLLTSAAPPVLWQRWLTSVKEAFKFVKAERSTLVLEGIRRLHVGVAVTKTCLTSPDPPRMLLRVLNRSAHLIGFEGYKESLRTLNDEGGQRWHSVALRPGEAIVVRNPENLELSDTPPGSFLPLAHLAKAVARPLEQLDELTFAVPAIEASAWPALLERARPHLVRLPT